MTKQLTSTSCTYFRLSLTATLLEWEEGRWMTIEIISQSISTKVWYQARIKLMKVWDRARIKLVKVWDRARIKLVKVWNRARIKLLTPGSAIRHISDCSTLPGIPAWLQMSRDMRFPTMWYVRPAKAQTSLRIRTVWSEPLLVACIFY